MYYYRVKENLNWKYPGTNCSSRDSLWAGHGLRDDGGAMTLYHRRSSSPRVPQDSPYLPDPILKLALILASVNQHHRCFSTRKLAKTNAIWAFERRYEGSTSSSLPRSSRPGDAFGRSSGIAASTLQNR